MPRLATGNPIPGPGPISAYADPTGTSICLYDTEEGILTVYILHNPDWEITRNANTSQFAAPKPSCLDGTYMDESTPFLHLGDSQSGIVITYAGCQSGGPFLILTIRYLVHGATPPGCGYWVVPDPAVGYVAYVDCSSTVHVTTGGVAIINGDEYVCDPVGTETSTWGRVKGLYR